MRVDRLVERLGQIAGEIRFGLLVVFDRSVRSRRPDATNSR
jgi:hypothetical protein